jgi:hypothetical protein
MDLTLSISIYMQTGENDPSGKHSSKILSSIVGASQFGMSLKSFHAACVELCFTPPLFLSIVVKGGSHPCYLDDPSGFTKRLVGFLNTVFP